MHELKTHCAIPGFYKGCLQSKWTPNRCLYWSFYFILPCKVPRPLEHHSWPIQRTINIINTLGYNFFVKCIYFCKNYLWIFFMKKNGMSQYSLPRKPFLLLTEPHHISRIKTGISVLWRCGLVNVACSLARHHSHYAFISSSRSFSPRRLFVYS